jgi:hypothetical protein
MFPTGAAGVALLILRLSVAATLLAHGAEHPFLHQAFALLTLVLPANALSLGFITPYAAGISCLIQLIVVVRLGARPALPIIISIMNTAALGILGPGAYSLDALIFGRRIVRVSASSKSTPI